MHLGDNVVVSKVVKYEKVNGVSVPKAVPASFKGVVIGKTWACRGEHNVRPKRQFQCWQVATSLTHSVKVPLDGVTPVAETAVNALANAKVATAPVQRVKLLPAEYQKLAEIGVTDFVQRGQKFTMYDVTMKLRSAYSNFMIEHEEFKPYLQTALLPLITSGKVRRGLHPVDPALEFTPV